MQTLSKAATLDPPTDTPADDQTGPSVDDRCPGCGDVSRGVCAACREWDGVALASAPPALIHDLAAVCRSALRGEAMTAELRRVLHRYDAEFSRPRIQAARVRCGKTAAHREPNCPF